MHIIYYVDGKEYKTDYYSNVPWDDISSPDENTPAIENLKTRFKFWCLKRINYHRLTGPSRIWANGDKWFCLNGKKYETIKEWIKDHPNPDMYFDAIGLNETDKVLWYLQN
jgi:hypothetical protein